MPSSKNGKGKTGKRMFGGLLPDNVSLRLDMSDQPHRVGQQQPKATRQSRQMSRPMGPIPGRLTTAPVALSRFNRQGAPVLNYSNIAGDGRCRVRHREYLQDVIGSVDYVNQKLPINPGLAQTFPWLSSIARNYESHHFNRLCFNYETQSSTSKSGTVILSVDYDAADSTPLTKQEQLQMHDAVRSAAWNESCFECSNADLSRQKSKFNRSGALVANQDIKTYDDGFLVVGVSGMADATAVGELYVEYDVEFMTPVAPEVAEGGGGGPSLPDAALISSVSGITSTTAWSTPPSLIDGSLLSAADLVGGKDALFYAPGNYIVVMDIEGTGLTGVGTNLTVQKMGDAGINDYATLFGGSVDAAGDRIIYYWLAGVSNGTTLRFTPGAGTTYTNSNIWICPAPGL